MMHHSELAKYDSYLAQVGQFRATEMSRVHKSPILAAVQYVFKVTVKANPGKR